MKIKFGSMKIVTRLLQNGIRMVELNIWRWQTDTVEKDNRIMLCESVSGFFREISNSLFIGMVKQQF